MFGASLLTCADITLRLSASRSRSAAAIAKHQGAYFKRNIPGEWFRVLGTYAIAPGDRERKAAHGIRSFVKSVIPELCHSHSLHSFRI